MQKQQHEQAIKANASALAGVVVAEFGSRVGASVCGSLLAQLGATVVLIEPVAESSSDKWNHRAQFAAGKLSLRPDPQSEADRKLVRDLVACSDALILSSDIDDQSWQFAIANAESAGVVCDVSAYGRSGALSGQPDTEWQIQATAGIVETTGMSDGMPVPISIPVVEFMTGVYAAAATVAALRVKRASGVGQLIDMALYDCAFAGMATFLPRVLTGGTEPIRRIGNRHAMIAPWNVYKARDGWILICVGTDAQWQRLCDIMGRSDLRAEPKLGKTGDRVANVSVVDAAVESWVGRHTVQECVNRLNDVQIACGPVVHMDGHPREPNLEFRDMVHRLQDPFTNQTIFVPGSPLRMSASPGRAPAEVPAPDAHRQTVQELVGKQPRTSGGDGATPRAALAGVRIVEIGHYTTVPLSTRMLASLGAEVIKIEPPEGEATRDWPPAQRGQGYFFTYMNSDKRSLILDLRRDSDAAILRDLVKTADVMIENLKPGALARRGFSAEELAAINPRLIYCSVSGFGSHSLYAGRPAYDSVIQAMSGIMDLVRSGDVPVKTGISSADLLGAEMAVLAVIAALAHRDRTGQGQYIDLSMQDISAWLTQTAWNGAGTSHPLSLIRCADGFALVQIDESKLSSMLKRLPGGDPRAASVALNRREMSARLKEMGILAAPVLSVHEMMAEPQTTSRNLWFTVTDNGETWPLMASPIRLVQTPPVVCKPMPALGRDNEAILASLQDVHERV